MNDPQHEETFADTERKLRDIITTLRAQLAEARAERDDALRGKECFQRMTRAHWEALCAMRNEINEYIPMPSTDSGPLFSPEDGPIYADIAERVVADLKENRAYALALEAELKARADRAEQRVATLEAALAAPEVMHEDAPAAIVGEIGNQIHNLGCELQNDEDVSLRLSDLACRCWDAAKLFPTDRTALDRMLAEARNKALREAADELRGYGYTMAIHSILVLIEKPNAR